MVHIIRYPEEVLHFRNELAKHPEIYSAAEKLGTFEEIIGYVALRVGVAMDGAYSHKRMIEVLRILTQKLYERRNVTLVDVNGNSLSSGSIELNS